MDIDSEPRLAGRCDTLATVRLRFAICFALAAAVFAADSGFNGRWDITIVNEPRRRAWWLEIQDAGTPNPRGKFVSAYGGDLNIIEEISVKDDVLKFGWVRNDPPKPGAAPQRRHLVYTARLSDGKLIGTFEVEGQPTPPLKWVGVRAPMIREKDDGTWIPARPIQLFNGKDLSGWKGIVPGKELGWSVENGILKSTGGANNLVSEKTFWNFDLHVEFRLGKRSNSGIGLRGRYEIQILEDYGRPPNSHTNGALYSRIAPSENASKPAGEWQTYDIRLVGMEVTVKLNGKTVIDRGEIQGLTAMATDANEGEPGPLTLQGDHGPVEFRSIVITPLKRSGGRSRSGH